MTTGQITITDNNDSKLIQAMIITPGLSGFNQTYSDNNGVTAWVLPWNESPFLVLTPKVIISQSVAQGGPTDITGNLTAIKWSYFAPSGVSGTSLIFSSPLNGATAQPNGTYFNNTTAGFSTAMLFGTSTVPTLTIKANLKATASNPKLPIYFEATYTEPGTGIVSSIIACAEIGLTLTGTNATWVRIGGTVDIISSYYGVAESKSVVLVYADLIKPALTGGVDNNSVTYKWEEIEPLTRTLDNVYGGGTSGSILNTKYGFLSTTAIAYYAANNGSIYPTTYNGHTANIGNTITGTSTYTATSIPTDDFTTTSPAFTDRKALVIHEDSVNGTGDYAVSCKDALGNIYKGFFTILDRTDPYQLTVASPSGDVLKNGTGSLALTPVVYYNGTQISSAVLLAGWTFYWQRNDKLGNRTGFIASGNANQTGAGWTISAATLYSAGNATITIKDSGGGIPTAGTYASYFTQGTLIKILLPDGLTTYRYAISAAGYNSTTGVISFANASATSPYAKDFNPAYINETNKLDTSTWVNVSGASATDITTPLATSFVGGTAWVCDYYKLTPTGGSITLTYVDAKSEIDVKGTFVCSGILNT